MSTKEDIALEAVPSESSKLAERYGISIFKAREILDACGEDATCIEQQARKAEIELKQDFPLLD